MMDLREFFAEDGKPIDESNMYESSNMDIALDGNPEDTSEIRKETKSVAVQSSIKAKVAKLLNAGFNERQILKVLGQKYASMDLSFINSALKANSGIVGTVCVDCSALRDRHEFNTKESKFKAFNKYAVNCTCDSGKVSVSNEMMATGSLDGFLSVSKTAKTELKGVCKKTSLPKISSFDQIKDGDALEAIYKLSSLGYFDKDTAKKLLIENDRITAIKKAFELTKVKKTADLPVVGGFYMKKSDMNIAIDKPSDQKQMDNINASSADMDIAGDIMDEASGINVKMSNENDKIYGDDMFENLKSSTEDFDVEEPASESLDVEVGNEENAVNEDQQFGDAVSSVEDIHMDIVNESDANLNRLSIKSESEIKL